MPFDVIFSKILYIWWEKNSNIQGSYNITDCGDFRCIGGSGDDDGDGLEDKSVLNSPQEGSFLNFEFQEIHSDKEHGGKSL